MGTLVETIKAKIEEKHQKVKEYEEMARNMQMEANIAIAQSQGAIAMLKESIKELESLREEASLFLQPSPVSNPE